MQRISMCVHLVTLGNVGSHNSSASLRRAHLSNAFLSTLELLTHFGTTGSSSAPHPQLEKAATYEQLSEWASEDMMEMYQVNLHLPKFKLEESYDLKSALSSMGMSDAFDQSKADFSGMSAGRQLFLSNVFHKSFVEINEQGTEAAAGTGSEVGFRSRPLSMDFNADHPFLFFIRHNKTNCILFYGRFCSP